MLCSMCQHGLDVKKMWACSCPDGHCLHILKCPECGTSRRELTKEGCPDGRAPDVAAWAKKRAELYATQKRKRKT